MERYKAYKMRDPRFLAQERQIREHYAERMYQRCLQPDLQRRFCAAWAEHGAVHTTFWKAQPEIKALQAKMHETLCWADLEYDRVHCPGAGQHDCL